MFMSIPLKLPGFCAVAEIMRVKRNVEIKSFILIGFKFFKEKRVHITSVFMHPLKLTKLMKTMNLKLPYF